VPWPRGRPFISLLPPCLRAALLQWPGVGGRAYTSYRPGINNGEGNWGREGREGGGGGRMGKEA
jgi:hypothetical protein